MSIAETTDLLVTIELLKEGLLPEEAYTPAAIGRAIAAAVEGAL